MSDSDVKDEGDVDRPSIFEQQGLVAIEPSSSPEIMRKDSMMADDITGLDTIMEDDDDTRTKPKPKSRSGDKSTEKNSRHSSKNEGQHTDRRYLCYICHKLFTRRRSVRDHLNKIHGEKQWEPSKSLEVPVEPGTGEPVEPIEDIIARGVSAGKMKPAKAKSSSAEHDDEESEDEKPAKPVKAQKKAQQPVKVEPEPMSVDETQDDDDEDDNEELFKLMLGGDDSAPIVSRTHSEQSPAPVPASITAPAPVIGKKRPLPITKKGTAKPRSATPSKRLKLSESERSTPARSPSVAPMPKATSKLKKSLNIASPSSRASSRHPSPSPSVSAASQVSSNDDGEVFCICRRGDNHTWMIACDGTCDEWYHGKCIGIKERDGELIDKFICDRCAKEGLVTTWKRMCRRQDCRKPAKVFNNPPSKYCSVECGRMFFVDLIQRGDPGAIASKDGQRIIELPKPKKRRKTVRRHAKPAIANGADTPLMSSRLHTPAYSEDERSDYETDSSADEDELQNRGGALRAGEIKALLQSNKSIEAWRELGKRPATPPQEADMKMLDFDEFETRRLESLQREQASLTEREKTLEAREKMLELIKVRSASITDDMKKSNPKLKELCGFDARAAWCEQEFLNWYNNRGKQVLESGKIGPPPEAEEDDKDDEEESRKKGGVCIRNRCPKHGRQWQAQQIRELRFEQDLLRKKQENLSLLEQEIRGRGQIRALERLAV